MSTLLIESHYLPCIEYFAVAGAAEKLLLESHENYQKQTYRNRCRVMTAQGPMSLSIPILKSGGDMKIKDVKIDYRQNWLSDHWRTIRSAYGNAPFFEHYGFYFKEIYDRKYRYLFELNLQFTILIIKLLKLKLPLDQSTQYLTNSSHEIMDFRSRIHPKKPLKNNPFYKACNYNQIFGKKFVDNLSIIDLIFCEGPSAEQILISSKP